MKPFHLPEDFLLGSATSGFQTEGGDPNHTWHRWCEEGHIKDASHCLRASDHWHRMAEDLEFLGRTHQRTYRMGLEWSRIEPQEGRFDPTAIDHYRQELTLLRTMGIKPLVTLFHFALPLWFADLGGFLNRDSIFYFDRYVRHVVEQLGDLVQDYVTINEPNVYATNGYYFGLWPPGIRSFHKTMEVLRNLTRCHLRAYRAIHDLRKALGFQGRTRVGAAHHLIVFTPCSSRLSDRMATRLMAYLFQGTVLNAFTLGRRQPPLGFSGIGPHGRFSDFMGINYYSRLGVHGKSFSPEILSKKPRNDLGWEIYPEGLKQLCREVFLKYRLPIWITENGTCDGADAFRARFIYDHLKAVSELIAEGVKIQRYYHWSLMDNFELLEGESGPFGLVAVDFETQGRTLRDSGRFYGEVCRNNGVTEAMLTRWFKAQTK